MAENYREFNAGNNTEESEDKKTKKTSGNNQWGKSNSIIIAVLAVMILAVLSYESVYSIGEQEQGVVTTFGKAGDRKSVV